MTIISILAEPDTIACSLLDKKAADVKWGFKDGFGNTLQRGCFDSDDDDGAVSYAVLGYTQPLSAPVPISGNTFWLRVGYVHKWWDRTGPRIALYCEEEGKCPLSFRFSSTAPDTYRVYTLGASMDLGNYASYGADTHHLFDFRMTIAPKDGDPTIDVVTYDAYMDEQFLQTLTVEVAAADGWLGRSVNRMELAYGTTLYGDDHVITSAILTANEPTLGMVIKTLDFTADGTVTGMTGGFADVNAFKVDEATSINSDIDGTSSTFVHSGLGALSSQYTVKGVVIAGLGHAVAGSPTPNLQAVMHNGTTEYEIGSAVDQTDNLWVAPINALTTVNPETGLAFTPAELDAMELGFKVKV